MEPREGDYVPDRLLLSPGADADATLKALEDAAASHGWRIETETVGGSALARDQVTTSDFPLGAGFRLAPVIVVRIVPVEGAEDELPPDAYRVLRSAAKIAGGEIPGVELDRVRHLHDDKRTSRRPTQMGRE